MFFHNPPRAVLSPCIGICNLDEKGYCEGCHRNTDEIANWVAYSDDERLRIMNEVLVQRARERKAI